MDLPQLAPEKLLPIHLTTDLSDDAKNETKSEPKSKVWLLSNSYSRSTCPVIKVQTPYVNKNKSHLKEKSAARLKAIINELNPKVEGVRKVTLLEEASDCVLPWLEQLDIVMAQKLGKFQSYFHNPHDFIRLTGI